MYIYEIVFKSDEIYWTPNSFSTRPTTYRRNSVPVGRNISIVHKLGTVNNDKKTKNNDVDDKFLVEVIVFLTV